VPTVKPKQTITEIEFQELDSFGGGTVNAIPAFTGGDWVPIMAFHTDSSGEYHGPTTVFPVIDFRPDLRDMLSDLPLWPETLTYAPAKNDAVVENYSIHVATNSYSHHFDANFVGRVGFHRAWFRNAGGNKRAAVVNSDTYTPAIDAMEHLYLVAAVSNGVEVFPIVNYDMEYLLTAYATHKGILMVTDIQPISGGPHASADLPFATGLWQNFDPVPSDKTLYVTTYKLKTTLQPCKFSQSAGGVFTMVKRAVTTDDLAFLFNMTDPSAAATFSADLRGLVPANARAVMVHIAVTNVGVGATVMAIVPHGLTATDTIVQMVNDSTYMEYGPHTIPCLFHSENSDDQQIDLIVHPVTMPATGTIDITMKILGWSY